MERSLCAEKTSSSEVRIINLSEFVNKLRQLKNDGLSNLGFVCDFDLTFTRYKTNQVRGCSTYQLISSSVLKGERAAYSESLYNHYHPLEIDPSVPADVKAGLMNEWWDKSNHVLLESGFQETHLLSYIFESSLYFRYGVREFIQRLNQNNLELVIVSGGIGNLIEKSLDFVEKVKNFKLFSNFIAFDEHGKSSHFLTPDVRTDKSLILKDENLKKNLFVMGDLPSVFFT
jgi:5'-nucleotidase